MTEDITFENISAYGSEKWCAAKLGKTLNWFKTIRKTLEHDGFPPPDPLIGLTLKADVISFICKRQRISEPVTSGVRVSIGENFHEF